MLRGTDFKPSCAKHLGQSSVGEEPADAVVLEAARVIEPGDVAGALQGDVALAQKIVTPAIRTSTFTSPMVTPGRIRSAPAVSRPAVPRLHDSIASSPRNPKIPLRYTRQNFE